MSDTVCMLPACRVDDSAIAVKYGAHQWSWREILPDAASAATALLTLANHNLRFTGGEVFWHE